MYIQKGAIDIAKQNLELLKHFEEVARTKYRTATWAFEIGPFPSITLRVNSMRSGQALIGFVFLAKLN